MVKPLQHRPQSLGEFNIRTGTNTVYQQKAQNVAGLGEAFQAFTDPIMESVIGGEAEAKRLTKYEIEKNLPIEQVPQAGDEGFDLWSLTKWGKARDSAYNELDKQIIEYQAEKALQDLSNEVSNPATEGPGMTRRYEDRAAQIIDAYKGAAVPANQNAISLKLADKAQNYRFQLAQREQRVAYDRTKRSLDAVFKADLAKYEEAALNNDGTSAVIQLKKIEDNITSQVNANLLTAEEARATREEIASLSRKSFTLGSQIDAISRGEGEKHLADFIKNPPEGMTVSEVFESAQKMNQLQNTYDASISKWEGIQRAQLNQDIITGKTTEPHQINNYDLSGEAYIEGTTQILRAGQERKKAQAEFKMAEDAIRNNESSSLPKSTITKLYDETQLINSEALESAGSRLTPRQRSQSILGTGEVYPVSGIRGQSLGTNVPEFDNLIGGMLTSGNPDAMIEAANIFTEHNYSAKQPNTLSLDGDELLVATSISAAMRSGQDPMIAASNAMKTILDKSNPAIQLRAADFDKAENLKKLPREFKDAFGTDVADFENDEAFATYKVLLRQNTLAGASKEAAQEATRYQMKGWSKSRYFPDNKVLMRAPESLNIYKAGFSFPNEQVVRIQELIDANPNYKWANPEHNLDIDSLTDDEKVLLPLAPINQASNLDVLGIDVEDVKAPLPRIKVKNAYGEHESEVYLWTDAGADYTANSNPRYNLVYKDQFGNVQPLMDETGIRPAYFNPAPLSQWAPSYFTSEKAKELKTLTNEIYNAPAKEAFKRFRKQLGAGGVLNPKLFGEIKNVREALKVMEERTPEEIQKSFEGKGEL